MAVNLSTPSEELLRTLQDEQKKALWWMKKHFGGESKYETMRDQLLVDAKRLKTSQRSELVEYKSAKGNRWLAFEEARYYPEISKPYTMPYAFCYWETYGSVGMFLVASVPGVADSQTILIFTSHFFQRWCERDMGKMMGRQTIIDFIARFDGLVVNPYIDKDGRKAVDVRICDTIGRGFVRNDNKHIYEVRTVLPDKMLSNAQRRFTKNFRERSDLMKDMTKPADIRMYEVFQNYNAAQSEGRGEEFYEEMISKYAKCAGIPEDHMKVITQWLKVIPFMLFELAGVEQDFQLISNNGGAFLDTAINLMKHWEEHHDNDSFMVVMKDELLALAEKVHLGVSRKNLAKSIDKHLERYK